MVDACEVHRLGVPVTDYLTGQVTASRVLVYSGRCKVQQTISQASNPSSGGHAYTVQDVRWDTPVGSGPFLVDDEVVVTAAVLDPQLVGRVYRVSELFHKSGATAQRVRVEEVVA
jgi:O-succinylbenzoate synthase